ncbi:hypothetical protein ACJTM1_26990 [Bacillus sp. GX]|nr:MULTISPECIES: hypothetical protein [Bacillus]UPL47232.1 hypothetical protein MU858_29785 [Bacillus sp. PGP15]WPU77862.1 hypothetical protein SNE23_29525 [Bacillus sp. RA(2023)]
MPVSVTVRGGSTPFLDADPSANVEKVIRLSYRLLRYFKITNGSICYGVCVAMEPNHVISISGH